MFKCPQTFGHKSHWLSSRELLFSHVITVIYGWFYELECKSPSEINKPIYLNGFAAMKVM